MLALALLLMIFSCGNGGNGDPSGVLVERSGANRHILVFLDKTLSLKQDNTSLEGYKESLKRFVYRNYYQNGDRVHGYFIHSDALGTTPFLEETFQVAKPDLEKGGYQTQEDNKMKYEMKLAEAKGLAIQSISKGFQLENTSETNRETDLWASFELMTRFFADAGLQDTCYAFFISDMVQSVKGEGQHDFHRYQIKTKEEAENLAMEAAKWIRENREVDPQVLSRVEVRMWIPPNPTGKNDFGMLRYYWNKLFAELGVREVREELI